MPTAAKKSVKKTTKKASKPKTAKATSATSKIKKPKTETAKASSKTPKIKKVAASSHILLFEYRGTQNAELEKALAILLRRYESGSGYDFHRKTRDLSWDYSSRLGADNAMKTLKKWWSKERRNYKGIAANVSVASY